MAKAKDMQELLDGIRTSCSPVYFKGGLMTNEEKWIVEAREAWQEKYKSDPTAYYTTSLYQDGFMDGYLAACYKMQEKIEKFLIELGKDCLPYKETK